MIIKAHIEINLENGEKIKYVNPNGTGILGKNKEFYSYTNETGDTYNDQSILGKVKYDYESLVNQIDGTNGLISWPEGGTILTRKNKENSLSSPSITKTAVAKQKIVSIHVVEQEITEFEQLDLQRKGII